MSFTIDKDVCLWETYIRVNIWLSMKDLRREYLHEQPSENAGKLAQMLSHIAMMTKSETI